MADTQVSSASAVFQCKSCEGEFGPNEFYVSNQSKCKSCVRKAVRDNRLRKRDYYRSYDKKRYQEDPRIAARHRRYQATPAGKASINASREKWLAENPQKRAAHVAVGNAVRDGRLSKPDTCSECGSGGRIHGHHEDYSKPLDVIWLCPKCHHKVHEGDGQ